MKGYLRTALSVLFSIFILAGCVGGGGNAPSGSSLTIYPSFISITDNGTDNKTQLITASLKDSNGEPLREIDIWVSFSPISNTGSDPGSSPLIQVYDGITPVETPFSVKTDKNGIYAFYVRLRTGGGLSYTTSLEVRSGDNYGSIPITVSPR